jgi:hypothetical protein
MNKKTQNPHTAHTHNPKRKKKKESNIITTKGNIKARAGFSPDLFPLTNDALL